MLKEPVFTDKHVRYELWHLGFAESWAPMALLRLLKDGCSSSCGLRHIVFRSATETRRCGRDRQLAPAYGKNIQLQTAGGHKGCWGWNWCRHSRRYPWLPFLREFEGRLPTLTLLASLVSLWSSSPFSLERLQPAKVTSCLVPRCSADDGFCRWWLAIEVP